jgi:DNA-directed RNA polymerase subunit M/transcription elongation factor TFIIS
MGELKGIERMVTIILQTVPICPECQAMLFKRHQKNDTYYCCLDCMNILKVIGQGKAENEVIVTDGKE